MNVAGGFGGRLKVTARKTERLSEIMRALKPGFKTVS
jgi:hypothetical protein